MSEMILKPASTQKVDGVTYPAYAGKEITSVFADPANVDIDVIKLADTGYECKRSQALKTQLVQVTCANKVLAHKDPKQRESRGTSTTTTTTTSTGKVKSGMRWEYDPAQKLLVISAPDINVSLTINPAHEIKNGNLAATLALHGTIAALVKFGGKALSLVPEYHAGVVVAPGFTWDGFSSTATDITAAAIEIRGKAMQVLPTLNLIPDALMARVTAIMACVPEPSGVSYRNEMLADFPEPVTPKTDTSDLK